MTREEILQAFDDINFVYNDCTRYDTLKRMLEELTERKRGEWIEINDGLVKGYCSQCGWLSYYYENEIIGMNYCPNCGADMREERG